MLVVTSGAIFHPSGQVWYWLVFHPSGRVRSSLLSILLAESGPSLLSIPLAESGLSLLFILLIEPGSAYFPSFWQSLVQLISCKDSWYSPAVCCALDHPIIEIGCKQKCYVLLAESGPDCFPSFLLSLVEFVQNVRSFFLSPPSIALLGCPKCRLQIKRAKKIVDCRWIFRPKML